MDLNPNQLQDRNDDDQVSHTGSILCPGFLGPIDEGLIVIKILRIRVDIFII